MAWGKKAASRGSGDWSGRPTPRIDADTEIHGVKIEFVAGNVPVLSLDTASPFHEYVSSMLQAVLDTGSKVDRLYTYVEDNADINDGCAALGYPPGDVLVARLTELGVFGVGATKRACILSLVVAAHFAAPQQPMHAFWELLQIHDFEELFREVLCHGRAALAKHKERPVRSVQVEDSSGRSRGRLASPARSKTQKSRGLEESLTLKDCVANGLTLKEGLVRAAAAAAPQKKRSWQPETEPAPRGEHGVDVEFINGCPLVILAADSALAGSASWLLQSCFDASGKADSLYEYVTNDKDLLKACLARGFMREMVCLVRPREPRLRHLTAIGASGKRSAMLALVLALFKDNQIQEWKLMDALQGYDVGLETPLRHLLHPELSAGRSGRPVALRAGSSARGAPDRSRSRSLRRPRGERSSLRSRSRSIRRPCARSESRLAPTKEIRRLPAGHVDGGVEERAPLMRASARRGSQRDQERHRERSRGRGSEPRRESTSFSRRRYQEEPRTEPRAKEASSDDEWNWLHNARDDAAETEREGTEALAGLDASGLVEPIDASMGETYMGRARSALEEEDPALFERCALQLEACWDLSAQPPDTAEVVEFLAYRFLLHTLRRDDVAMNSLLLKYRGSLAGAQEHPHMRWAKRLRQALLQGRLQRVLQLQDEASEQWIPGYDTRGTATGFLASLAAQDTRLRFLRGASVAFSASVSRGRLSKLLGHGKSELRPDDPLEALPVEVCMQEARDVVDLKATAAKIAAREGT